GHEGQPGPRHDPGDRARHRGRPPCAVGAADPRPVASQGARNRPVPQGSGRAAALLRARRHRDHAAALPLLAGRQHGARAAAELGARASGRLMQVDEALLKRLSVYPFLVATWVDDAGYPISVATTFQTDGEAPTLLLNAPGLPIPTDREVSVIASHIRPQPGVGYDERRYLCVWGRASAPQDGVVTFSGEHAWGWDEAEVPFFEYSERSVPQSRRYLEQLSAERGRPIKPRLALPWLILRTTRLPFLTATFVPVLLGLAIAARHGPF